MMSILQFLGSPASRWARIIAGLILVVPAVAVGTWWWILALLGALFIAVGAFDVYLLAPLVGKPVQRPAFRKTFTS